MAMCNVKDSASNDESTENDHITVCISTTLTD